MPLPTPKKDHTTDRKAQDQAKEIQTLRQQVRNLSKGTGSSTRTGKGQQKPKGGPKGKGKGKGDAKGIRMPPALKGGVPTLPDGTKLCFAYNEGHCNKPKCQMEHICCYPGCGKKHPFVEVH